MLFLQISVLSITGLLSAAQVEPQPVALSCAKGLVWRCGPPCPKKCEKLNTRCLAASLSVKCTWGCYCPKDDQYMTCDSDFKIKCVDRPEKCYCPGGQVFTLSGSKYTKTCNRPEGEKSPFEDTPDIPVARCQCPGKKPIWHMGMCITEHQCICPTKCATEGCKICNKCKCRNGRSLGCTKKGCPQMNVKPSVIKMEISGCWRMCPSSKMCIFYYPCPDAYSANTCDPMTGPFVWPTSYCKRCHKCRCEKNEELCEGGSESECGEKIWRQLDKGCWTLVKGECRYVWPCPQKGDTSCECATPGTVSCKMCKKCECVYGKKICGGPDKCPDPKPDGCTVMRMYDGVINRCYFVSPCPGKPTPCRFDMSKIYTDGCYIYNEKWDRCEYVSPCPETTCCCNGDFTCKKCNKCRCSKGKIRCTRAKCGDPVPKGCWVYNDFTFRCEFISPCPRNAVTNPKEHCLANPVTIFCQANDCNQCKCGPNDGLFSCGRRACPEVKEANGVWHASCLTKNCVFVHSDTLG